MGDGRFVLIGPIGWQIIGLVVLMVVGWWLLGRVGQSEREPAPSLWRAFWWSLACKYFPGVTRWIVSTRAALEEDASPVTAPAHAHTGADDDPAFARGAHPSTGAGAPSASPVIAFSTHRAQQAARRMIRHKMAVPTADMLDTIRAGFPEIKSRSGDPKSKYQLYGKPVYDALFSEPEPDLPTLQAQQRPSVAER